ncbi:MAG: class I SAM-dependent methyltransferase [Hyphomicrobiales bacterium]|nr:class I SAM-dependent methyltransferase [Hyphomicrobiales bacterium]
MDWISFYDFKHSVIYVNGRHRDVHYETIARDIRALVPSPGAIVMDYGCGEATSAALVADACRHLTLVEAAPNVRAALRERFAANPKMSVMTPDEAAAQPAGSVDMIVLHSVAQYLTAAELDAMMATFKRLLKPAGTFVLGDIVPPQLASVWAALSLLRFGAANGFFWAAVGGLIRILLSDYFTLKKSHGLSHYDEADMMAKLRAAGFAPKRAAHNIGHNQHRMTFVSTPA